MNVKCVLKVAPIVFKLIYATFATMAFRILRIEMGLEIRLNVLNVIIIVCNVLPVLINANFVWKTMG